MSVSIFDVWFYGGGVIGGDYTGAYFPSGEFSFIRVPRINA
jgi:hypothetical protein